MAREPWEKQIDDDGWRKEVIRRSYEDPIFFCSFFFGQVFNKAWTKQRKDAIRLMSDLTVPYGFEEAYRGSGKTSRVKAEAVRRIVLRISPYQLHVRRDETEAILFTESVKSMLLLNPILTHPLFFGNMTPQKIQGYTPQFSKDAYFFVDPNTLEPVCFIEPVGVNAEVSGKQVMVDGKLYRPTWITIDDVEDRTQIDSEQYRSRIRNWMFKSLFPSVSDDLPDPTTNRWIPSNDPSWTPPWQIWVQDTKKHEDSFIARIENSEGWTGLLHPKGEFRNGKLYSSSPELVSTKQLRKEMQWYEEQGELDSFYVEQLCMSFARTEGHWTREDFKYYEEKNEKLWDRIPRENRFVVVDPARTSSASSAYTSMLAFGVDEAEPMVYFRKLVNERIRIQDIALRAFTLALEMDTDVIAVEVTGAEDGVRFQFTNDAASLGLENRFEFIWLDARTRSAGSVDDDNTFSAKDKAKRSRARPLIPFYKNGWVKHELSLKDSALEKQMLSFPRPAFWDALDTAGYVVVLMNRAGIRFVRAISDKEMSAARYKPEFEALKTVSREEIQEEEGWDDFIKSGIWRLG